MNLLGNPNDFATIENIVGIGMIGVTRIIRTLGQSLRVDMLVVSGCLETQYILQSPYFDDGRYCFD